MQDIINKKRAELIKMCTLYKIRRMYVFGSVLTKEFDENSDIDFIISFIENISIEEYTDNYFALHSKLKKLFNRKIDLVTEATLSNPYFIDSINESKELLYES